MTIHNPQMVYDFAAFAARAPMQPLPGDRVQSQFLNHADVLNEIIAQLNLLGTRLVTAGDLDPALLVQLQSDLAQSLSSIRDQVQAYLGDAQSAATVAVASAALGTAQAAQANSDLNTILEMEQGVAGSLLNLKSQADEAAGKVIDAAQRSENDANDAARDAALSQDYADVCQAWAEHMPDTIPPNILAIMGVTGDHWSSRWWANQASQITSTAHQDALNAAASAAAAAASASQAASSATTAQNAATVTVNNFNAFQQQYLGNKSSDPVKDNQGNPLIPGALYFNTTSLQLRNWSGTAWQNFPGGAGITDAPADGNTYGRKNNAWVIGGGSGGIPEAPNDANTYGRHQLGWSIIPPIPTTYDWNTGIANKPSTFPPSAHTHPMSDITGLSAALALLAPKADPVFTGTVNGDKLAFTGLSTFANVNITGTFNATGTSTFSNIAVPTQSPGTSDTTAASTAFVGAAVAAGNTGQVTGPALSTDNGVALWNGTTGQVLKNSGVLAAIARSGSYADLSNIPATVNALAVIAGAAADTLAYFTSATAMALTSLTAFARTLLGSANAAAARATLVAEQLGVLAGVNTQTANYTFTSADLGKVVELNLAGANTLSIDTDANQPNIPVGSRFDAVQFGAGQTTIQALTGVTLHNKYGPKFSAQYAAASFYKHAANEWVCFGDLTT